MEKITETKSNYSPKIGTRVREYFDGGRIALRVETTEQERQYYVRITVRDTRCGIWSEEQTRIFERFYRTAHTHEQAEGPGIGLMLAKHYVRLHSGENR